MSDHEEGIDNTLKQSIERRLADLAAQDPNFLAELMLHPDGVIKPLITEALGDDGEVNLAEVQTSVHVETSRNLQFVLSLPSGEVEGYGFDLGTALNGLGGIEAGGDALFKRKTKKGCPGDSVTTWCTFINKGCPTVYGNTFSCPKF